VAEGLITPEQLRRIAEEKEMEKMREALEKKRGMDEERHHFRDTFMQQDVPRDDPRARERFAAKRAYEFWQEELEPQGYKLSAQFMDFPGGVPGDVGLFLRW
jgi:hypothetical protein